MSSDDWLGDPRSLRAAERILDAAAALFAERGVAATQMADIARAAGCSRATLYRYFDSRRAVQLAFVHREARRLATTLTADLRTIPDPTARIVEGVLASLRAVRADPLLIAWFRPADAGITLELAQTSEVIESIATSLFATEPPAAQPDNALTARWLTRIIVSLLTVPGHDDNEERLFLERFVAPLITGTRA
ncbi:TetR/AcrR family transcriptional regulator [Nocardia terpenica]|uniref:TetR family transcriptional regulator n=1 Tax=Nocardia terpenica TaxID=455432 RepID=A0A164I0Q3_9NOCA|nr:TetR/AcrR family transcriptional regulator [Nocardia terpenica]KZM68991.1 TetR family transcriptional regulator [Nocardia terpenica]NQE87922.1 TetR/AcrR family transcriptional regulator [Nocardia terpenica]